jgi:hypothetical protein
VADNPPRPAPAGPEMTMSDVDINIEDPRSSDHIYRCIMHDIYALNRREPENRGKWNQIRKLLHWCRRDARRCERMQEGE